MDQVASVVVKCYLLKPVMIASDNLVPLVVFGTTIIYATSTFTFGGGDCGR